MEKKAIVIDKGIPVILLKSFFLALLATTIYWCCGEIKPYQDRDDVISYKGFIKSQSFYYEPFHSASGDDWLLSLTNADYEFPDVINPFENWSVYDFYNASKVEFAIKFFVFAIYYSFIKYKMLLLSWFGSFLLVLFFSKYKFKLG